MKSVKEKANELISIFGKELAPKVVDEILKSNPCSEGSDRGGNFMWVDDTYYWTEVKHELTKQQEQ
jgi:hypothetical protein